MNDLELTIDHVKNLTGVDDPVYLANHLYASLRFTSTGEALKIVDSKGTESCQRLIRRWDPANAQSGLSSVTPILSPQPVKKLCELLRTTENLEVMLRKEDERDDSHRHSTCALQTVPDTYAFTAMCKSYEAMMTAAREYVDSDPDKTKHMQNVCDDPKDVGACHGNPEYEDDEEGDLNRLERGTGKGQTKGNVNLSGKGFKGEC